MHAVRQNDLEVIKRHFPNLNLDQPATDLIRYARQHFLRLQEKTITDFHDQSFLLRTVQVEWQRIPDRDARAFSHTTMPRIITEITEALSTIDFCRYTPRGEYRTLSEEDFKAIQTGLLELLDGYNLHKDIAGFRANFLLRMRPFMQSLYAHLKRGEAMAEKNKARVLRGKSEDLRLEVLEDECKATRARTTVFVSHPTVPLDILKGLLNIHKLERLNRQTNELEEKAVRFLELVATKIYSKQEAAATHR